MITTKLQIERQDGTREVSTFNILYKIINIMFLCGEKAISGESSVALADDTIQIKTFEVLFQLSDEQYQDYRNATTTTRLHVLIESAGVSEPVPLVVAFRLRVPNASFGIIIASVILTGMYVLIILEIVHRTFAALMAATAAVASLSYVSELPTLVMIMKWVEVETLMMLFGMMIFVAIMAQTGAFDYLAVFSYRVTGGRIWPLIFTLGLLTFALVSFVDNVTAILLLTPVIIRICEVAELNPVPMLIMEITLTNVMGVATPIGDPTNILMLTNEYLIQNVSSMHRKLVTRNMCFVYFKNVSSLLYILYIGHKFRSAVELHAARCSADDSRHLFAISLHTLSQNKDSEIPRATRSYGATTRDRLVETDRSQYVGGIFARRGYRADGDTEKDRNVGA